MAAFGRALSSTRQGSEVIEPQGTPEEVDAIFDGISLAVEALRVICHNKREWGHRFTSTGAAVLR